jgi:hypothetical protein
MHTDIHDLNGIRTYDLSVRAGEDYLCLKLRGNCDQHGMTLLLQNLINRKIHRDNLNIHPTDYLFSPVFLLTEI